MPDAIAIVGGRALLGADLDPVDDATIILRGETIVEAGPAAHIAVPEDSDLLDARGLTVLPGFIDAHVHIGFHSPHDVLVGGVTTARDLAWPAEQIFPIASSSRDRSFDGPTIFAAGPMLTAPGGYPTRAGWAPSGTGLEVDDETQAREAVDRLATSGAAVIKVALNPAVGPTLSLSPLRTIVDRAHEHSLKVTGHVYGLDELQKAIDAGMDELAHMLMSPEPIPDQTIDAMVTGGMAIVSTLSIRFGPDQRIAIENTRRFVEAGGTIIYGTDLGNEGPRPGIDPREIDALSKAGLSSLRIIRSATVDSATWLGLERVGAIAPGHYADIVAVSGDATEDARALLRVEAVWRRGLIRRGEPRGSRP